MTPERSTLVIDRQDRDPLEEVALGPAWLRQLAGRQRESYLRVYRPRPAVAFSGKDCLQEGIGEAARAATERSFTPVRRSVGGRAAAYHRGSLGLDHLSAEPGELSTIRDRFAVFGAATARALQELGIPAVVGPVPGEYCPGEFSVNDGHGHKLVGTAQRLVRGAWLFTTMILVTQTQAIKEVLDSVYPLLAMEWDPATVGSVEDLIPGVTVDEVEQAVLRAYEAWLGSEIPSVPEDAVRAAVDARPRHRVSG